MRSSIASLAIVSFVFAGCSSAPPGDNVSRENESALTSCTCSVDDTGCDPTVCESGVEFALNSLTANADGSYSIGGYNSKGTFHATFIATTAFRAANLNPFSPGDPCRGFASQYNTLTNSSTVDGSVFTGPIQGMTANLCTAQVWLTTDATSIRAFKPKAP